MYFNFQANTVGIRDEHVSDTKAFQMPDDASWPEVLEHFLRFLSSVYGYDISDAVEFKGRDFV